MVLSEESSSTSSPNPRMSPEAATRQKLIITYPHSRINLRPNCRDAHKVLLQYTFVVNNYYHPLYIYYGTLQWALKSLQFNQCYIRSRFPLYIIITATVGQTTIIIDKLVLLLRVYTWLLSVHVYHPSKSACKRLHKKTT